MQQAVEVIFYDGVVSRPQPAELSMQGICHIQVQTSEQRYQYACEDVQLIGALGQLNPVIELPDEARIEFLQAHLPQWLVLKTKVSNERLWKMERSPLLIMSSLLVVMLVLFAMVQYGVPFAARQLAYHLPDNALQSIGSEAEQQVEKMTEKSQLPLVRQQHIRQLYQQHVADGSNATDQQSAKIVFRQGRVIGANALALPNQVIVLTDELVKLAKDDREIIAVLAHEQGHLVERHTMQQVLSALGMTIFITWITGDVSDLVSNAPYALLTLSYSREFERQADLYAMQLLSKQQIPVQYFTDFLKRLKTNEANIALLSTHPATSERVKAVEQFARQQRAVQP